jgi:hypothetical protein
MEKQTKRPWLGILATGLLALVAFWSLGRWLDRSVTTASAGSPPPNRPLFEGEPFTARINRPALTSRATVGPNDIHGGWNSVYTETFESGISPVYWDVFDQDGTENGEYKWGIETYTNTTPGGSYSAWAIGDGFNGGQLDPATDGYAPNTDSWLVYGPINMTDATDGAVLLDYWLQSEVGDAFGVAVSTDGSNYQGLLDTSGGSGSWSNVMYNLDSYIGESAVYIAFTFESDGSANPGNLKGAFLDQVVIMVQYPLNLYLPYVALGMTPTHTPTPTAQPTATPTATATAAPITYVDTFENPNSGWAIRRQNTDAPSNAVAYTGGKLQVDVTKVGDYAIVAPMIAATNGGYNIETQARFISPADQHGYGIVFAGDWNGSTCPNGSYNSCFNQYYWLEVRWLAGGGNPLLVFRVRKIESHSGSDNTPVGPTLINWTEVRTVNGQPVDPNAINEWDVRYESDGDIKIYVKNVQVGVVRDTSYLNNRYFGLTTSTLSEATSNPNAKVQFEYISVVPVTE